jgi:hypothetical protein
MSIKQMEANRKNGAKSHGPKTPAGKRTSSRNALKHGLTSQIVVLATEDQAEFDQMREEYHADLVPVGRVEFDLVDELVAAKWRQRRCCYLETNILSLQMDEYRKTQFGRSHLDKDLPAYAFISISDKHTCLADLSRFESRYRRSYEKALKDLLTLQKNRRQTESNEEPATEIENLQNEPNSAANQGDAPVDGSAPLPPDSPATYPHEPSIPGAVAEKPAQNPSLNDDLPPATC